MSFCFSVEFDTIDNQKVANNLRRDPGLLLG
jgi:hypothetical protein